MGKGTRDFRRGNKLALGLLGLGKAIQGGFEGAKFEKEIEQMLADRQLKQEDLKMKKKQFALDIGKQAQTTTNYITDPNNPTKIIPQIMQGIGREPVEQAYAEAGMTLPVDGFGSKTGKVALNPSEWSSNPQLRADIYAFQQLLSAGVKNSLNTDQADALNNLRMKLNVPITIKRVEDFASWVKDGTGFDIGVEYNVAGNDNSSSPPKPKKKLGPNTVFTTIEEAEKANLPKGTKITVGGKSAIVE